MEALAGNKLGVELGLDAVEEFPRQLALVAGSAGRVEQSPPLGGVEDADGILRVPLQQGRLRTGHQGAHGDGL